MTIGESQPPAHAVRVNCDWGTGTRVRIPQPVHGKDPERKIASFCIPFSSSVVSTFVSDVERSSLSSAARVRERNRNTYRNIILFNYYD